MKQIVASVSLGLATQALGVVLLATGMGAEPSPPGFPSRIGYLMCWPAISIAGWVGGSLGISEFSATMFAYLIGAAIWGSVWYLILALAKRVLSRAQMRAA